MVFAKSCNVGCFVTVLNGVFVSSKNDRCTESNWKVIPLASNCYLHSFYFMCVRMHFSLLPSNIVFQTLTLSLMIVATFTAGKPKKENALKTICLMLGPDFISDHMTVLVSCTYIITRCIGQWPIVGHVC